MTSQIITSLEAMLAAGRDDAVLRFGLGQAYLKEGSAAHAEPHLAKAVAHDPRYSAAWKLLAHSRAELGNHDGAMQAYRDGIRAAQEQGDKQAAREMAVFLKRIQHE